MATSQGFNKPKTDYIKVNRKKSQEKAKRTGKAEKGKKAQLAVSAIRTKKHVKKVDHRRRMLEKHMEEAATKASAAAVEAPAPEVKMGKTKNKRTKKEKSGAVDMAIN